MDDSKLIKFDTKAEDLLKTYLNMYPLLESYIHSIRVDKTEDAFEAFKEYLKPFIEPGHESEIFKDAKNRLDDYALVLFVAEHKKQHKNYKAMRKMKSICDYKFESGLNWQDTQCGALYWCELLA